MRRFVLLLQRQRIAAEDQGYQVWLLSPPTKHFQVAKQQKLNSGRFNKYLKCRVDRNLCWSLHRPVYLLPYRFPAPTFVENVYQCGYKDISVHVLRVG